MAFVTIHEARIKLSQLLKKVSAGEEVIISNPLLISSGWAFRVKAA
jgi:hypothetical protein